MRGLLSLSLACWAKYPPNPGPTGARGQRITAVMNRCTDIKSDMGQGLAGLAEAELFFSAGRPGSRGMRSIDLRAGLEQLARSY